MAAYTTVNGQILHETRGGTETELVPDPLGSVIQTRGPNGSTTSSTVYWPYGETRTSTGTNPTSWGYVGSYGYHKDTGDLTYVRARHYRPTLARWQTVDPLWPNESAFHYIKGAPSMYRDPSGLLVQAAVGAGAAAAAFAFILLLHGLLEACRQYPYFCSGRWLPDPRWPGVLPTCNPSPIPMVRPMPKEKDTPYVGPIEKEGPSCPPDNSTQLLTAASRAFQKSLDTNTKCTLVTKPKNDADKGCPNGGFHQVAILKCPGYPDESFSVTCCECLSPAGFPQGFVCTSNANHEARF